MSSDRSDIYWNYVSSLTPAESEESLKDLFAQNFDFLRPYLDEIFWINAMAIYLNLVCGVNQRALAKFFKMSQYGVSKKIKSGILKLRGILLRPEEDINVVRKDLSLFLTPAELELMIIYYQVKTFAMTARIVSGISSGSIRIKVLNGVERIRAFSLVKSESDLEELRTSSKLKAKPDVDLETYKYSAERYLKYFDFILSQNNYSDYSCKKKDLFSGTYN